ncbi:hypothetical protein [Acidovorax sp. CCYZU-2555]|nr:hypothetical protein [Acidovorax sp. CCYZU-2555]MBS7777210.1 hypothetical protein [Acidovorax sp. CCYZU-2555]
MFVSFIFWYCLQQAALASDRLPGSHSQVPRKKEKHASPLFKMKKNWIPN